MKEFVFRVGIVFWWLGTATAVFGALLLAGAIASAVFGDARDVGVAIGMSFTPLLLMVLAMYSLCFICTGSFWRRPRLPR